MLKVTKVISTSTSYNRFIIYSRSRSGSTMLVDYLNNHPNINCKGELFQYLYKSIHEQWNSVWTLQKQPIKSMGFKLFYNHPFNGNNQDIRNIILQNRDIKIIHLIRKNLLEIVASQELAEQTEAYTYSKKSDKKTVYIPIQKCKKSFDYTLKGSREIERTFNGNNYLKIYYEDLVKEPNSILKEIFQFLNVDESDVHTNIIKQNKLKMKDKVINYNELKTYFSRTEFNVFFD